MFHTQNHSRRHGHRAGVSKSPALRAKILSLAVFPCGEQRGHCMRRKIVAIDANIAKRDDAGRSLSRYPCGQSQWSRPLTLLSDLWNADEEGH